MEVKVVMAPPGEDPDSLARQRGAEGILEVTAQALDFIQFRVRNLEVGTLGIIGKEKLIKELGGIASKIGDPTRRMLFIDEAATTLNVEPATLQWSVSPADELSSANDSASPKGNPEEFELLSLLFCGPGDIDAIFEKISPEDFDSRQLSRLYAAMANQYRQTGVVNASSLSGQVQDVEFLSLITAVASRSWPPEEVDAATATVVNAMTQKQRRRIRAKLRKDMEEAIRAGDELRANRLLKEIHDLE
jgi:DNA primase